MSKRKVSVVDKIYAVNLYLDGKESQRRIADMFDVLPVGRSEGVDFIGGTDRVTFGNYFIACHGY